MCLRIVSIVFRKMLFGFSWLIKVCKKVVTVIESHVLRLDCQTATLIKDGGKLIIWGLNTNYNITGIS